MIALCLFLTGTTYAIEPVPASKAVTKTVAELLKTEIDFPDFAREDDFECCVLVRLYINEDGSFDVDCANCKDDRLEMYVKDNIEKIISREHAQFAGQTVSIKVVFKII